MGAARQSSTVRLTLGIISLGIDRWTYCASNKKSKIVPERAWLREGVVIAAACSIANRSYSLRVGSHCSLGLFLGVELFKVAVEFVLYASA